MVRNCSYEISCFSNYVKQKIDQNMIKKSQSMKEAIWFHSDKSDPFSFVINIASFLKEGRFCVFWGFLLLLLFLF